MLEHKHWIVEWVNALLTPVLGPLLARAGVHPAPEHDLIPDYLVMSLLIVIAWTVFGFFLRSRLSVDNPSRTQIVLEDLVSALAGLLDDFIGPKGRQFLPLVGALGAFIFAGNYAGLVPGLMSPTSNMNVTAGCAITIWVYYHLQGIRHQGIVSYLLHFVHPPGVPWLLAPLMIIIEPISHASRMLSLTLRLFGNIFGEEMIIAILLLLSPWWFPIPVPMMALGMITGLLQAFVFVLLSVIYLQGAVAVEHDEEEEDHGRAGHQHHPLAVEA